MIARIRGLTPPARLRRAFAVFSLIWASTIFAPSVQAQPPVEEPEPIPLAQPAPPPLPLPALPPGFGMGGYPARPETIPDPSRLGALVQDNLTMGLRNGGLLRPYGFFRLDVDVASSRFNDLQNPFFVLPNDPRFRTGPNNVPITPNDFNYSIYPRLTTAGLEYYGSPIDSFGRALPSGRLEIDFLTSNPSGSESRELLRLRLAYLAVQVDDFTLVVGQDWDIVAPLIPTINSNTNQWFNGNLGDRRPQVKLLWDHDFGEGVCLQVQNGLALADAINNVDRDGNGLRDQEAWGLPGYEGRLGFVVPSAFRNQPIMGGVWAFAGKQETSVPIGSRTLFPFYGFGLDLRFPIHDWLAFQGEVWNGRNLDDFRGGIAQGINPVTGAGIESTGGWAELVFRPVTWYQGSVGFSIDNPNRSDIPTGGRTRNYAWYIGTRFPVGGGLLFGMDYQNWTTEYKELNLGHANLVKFFAQLNY